MGIRGLSSFVDKYPELLVEHKFHDTKVIIDGNNLYHFLFYHYHVPHKFGGDYDHYSRKVIRYFRILRQCNVSPYIVFDGGYEPDDRKFSTVIQRVEKRIHMADTMCSVGRGNVLPILAYETFRRVLVEMGIPHVSSGFEADDQIAALAHDWGCPVMSNDSDFFIYDLKGGFVPFDYVNLTLCVYDTVTGQETVLKAKQSPTATQKCYIPVKMYNTNHFVKHFKGIEKHTLPLFATLMGNDIVDGITFTNFFARLAQPERSNKKVFVTKAHSKMVCLMHWLNSLENIEEGLEEVIGLLPRDIRDEVQLVIHKSMDGYSNRYKYSSLDLRQFFEGSQSDSDLAVSELSDYKGVPLPQWFVCRLRRCEMSPFMQNTAVLRRIFMLCQIEQLSKASSFCCSSHIRLVMYSIILGSCSTDMPDKPQEQRATRQTHMLEYDRKRKYLKKNWIELACEIPGRTSFQSLTDLPGMAVSDRTAVVMATLGVSQEAVASWDESFDQSEVFFILLVATWLQHAEPKVSRNHLVSLLLCWIMLQCKRWKWLRDTEQDSSTFQSGITTRTRTAIEASTQEGLAHAEKFFDKHLRKVEVAKKNPRDEMIVHGFAQFQACVLDAINLNQLMLCPFPSPHPGLIFNGTFVYSVCRDLHRRLEVDAFVEEILVKNSPLHLLFQCVENRILHETGQNCFQMEDGYKKRSNKKRKKKRSGKREVTAHRTSDSNDSGGEKDKTVTKAACCLDNRFSLLNLED